MGDSIDTSSTEFYLGQITTELKSISAEQGRLANEQGNIYTRLNNQNGQIGRLATAVAENTQVVRDSRKTVEDICDWRDDHEREHRAGLTTRIQNGVKLWEAIIAGVIITVISSGATYILTR